MIRAFAYRPMVRRALGAGLSLGALAGTLVPAAAWGQEVRGPESPQPTSQALSPASTAAPEPTQDGSGVGLADIVVTARKIAENLQDVPIAVTAFTAESLEGQNAVRVSDVARLTPSLTIREANSNPTAISIALRGQVQTDILATLDPSVGTYVDGLYWARAYGLNADLLDLQSVQVLKGPQGTLFGRNTTGGALLFQTNDPTFNGFTGLVSGTYGRFDERAAAVVVNAPIIDNVLSIRGAFQFNKRDGYIRDTVNGQRYNDRDNWTGRVKVLLTPTDNLSLLFSAERFESETNSPSRRLGLVAAGGLATTQAGLLSGFPAATAAANGLIVLNNQIAAYNAGSRNDVALTVAPYTDVKTQTYNGTATLDTFFGAVKFIGGYRRVETQSIIDLDGTALPIHVTRGLQDLEQYSGELQFTGKAFNDAVDFAAGVTYFKEKGADQSVSVTVPSLLPRQTRFRGDIDNDAMGIYAQASWHLTDALTFTGGLRYSVEDKGLQSRNGFVTPIPTDRTRLGLPLTSCAVTVAVLANGCFLQRRDDFSALNYTAGLDYKLAPDVLVYAKISTGFRSGGQNLRATTDLATLVPFQPERSTSIEGGLKSEFLDRRVRLNLAGFYDRVRDIQRTTFVVFPNGNNGTVLGNAGKVRIYGLEAELAAQLFQGFTLSATGGLTKPKYIEYRDVILGDRSAERFENVPEYSFSISGSYVRDIGVGKLNLRADFSWQDEYALQPQINFAGNPTQARDAALIAATTAPSAGVLSARAGLILLDDKLDISVFGRNITNNRGITSALIVPAPLGYATQQYRDPATYGVTATIRFGQ